MQIAPFVRNSSYFSSDGRIKIPSQDVLLMRESNFEGEILSLYERRLDSTPIPASVKVSTIISDQQSVYTAFYYPDGQREPYYGWTGEDAERYIISLFEYKQTHNSWIFNTVLEGDRYVKYILDSGHRFFNLMSFLNDGFKVKGRLWSQWKIHEKQQFLSITIQTTTYTNLNQGQCREIMDLVNTQLSLSKGELTNTYSLTGDEWLKFAKGMFMAKTESCLTSMFGKNDRQQHLLKLNNFAEKFRTLSSGKGSTCTGNNDYVKICSGLHKFYTKDSDVAESRQMDLLNHTVKVLELFPREHKGLIQVFDMYLVFIWAFNHKLEDDDKTRDFLNAIYNPIVSDGKWHKLWRNPEVSSGHGKDGEKAIIKYKIYRYFCSGC